MHHKANQIRDAIGYKQEDVESSIEEKVFKALHPEEE